MQISISGFGSRLREARKEKGFSAQWMCNYLNGYLVSAGYPAVALNTYYSWEYIGSAREVLHGRSLPHPLVYKLLTIPLGITGYWLFFGDLDGRIVKRRDRLPAGVSLEQVAGVGEPDPLRQEFNRVAGQLNAQQRQALLVLLKQF